MALGYVRNAWYMAGWADELDDGQLLARTLLEQPVVLFRRPDGTPAALEDRCPHRLAPLSRGRVLEDGIQCGYHGLQFDAAGQCVNNPHGPIPGKARVRPFPLVERWGILWIWMGDPARADADHIPDLADMAATPASAQSRGAMPTACHYQLIIDNVADLSHVEYLHARTLGGGAFVGGRPAFEQRGDTVRIGVAAAGQTAPPLYAPYLDHPAETVTFRNTVEWEPVGLLRLTIDIEPDGPSGGQPLQARAAHIVTPEGRASAHYWFWLTRSFRTEDRAITDRRHAQLHQVFLTEDKPMLEAQQARIGDRDLFAAGPVMIATDGGAVRVRRILDRMVDAEREPA